jgi:hypothetical protein
MIRNLLSTLILVLFAVRVVHAQHPAPPISGVPEQLAPWIDWVRLKHPEWGCARVRDNFECSWPGSVHFHLSPTGASFRLTVSLMTKQSIPLPYDDTLHPRDIKVQSIDGSSAVDGTLKLDGGQLILELPAGNFIVSGAFAWNEIPQEIPLPSSYGMLSVSGVGEALTQRNERGFSLVEAETRSNQNPTLGITVARRVIDGSPLTVMTRLDLRASGQARSVRLGRITPAKMIPISISSPLPYQLQPDGTLSVQLVPGEHVLSVTAIQPQPVDAIDFASPELPEWPQEETIVWQPAPELRSVEVSGLSPLSAELSQLPPDFQGGATYVAQRGAMLNLKEISRGEQSVPPDQISLRRTLWIDIDGGGFTVQDAFSGTLRSSRRLNALQETAVGRATISGAQALIAPDPAKQLAGIEIRQSSLDLAAVSRLGASRSISAIGWDTPVNSVNMQLMLPPSWKLVDVRGVSDVTDSWVGSWTLLDVFITMMIVLGAYQLFGTHVAALLGVSLCLNQGEFLAPKILFVHIMLISAWLAFSRRDSTVRSIAKTLLAVTFIAWSLQSLAFLKLQVTQLLFPQLQAGTRYRTILQQLILELDRSFLFWPYLMFLLACGLLAVSFSRKGSTLWKKTLRGGLCAMLFVPVAIFTGAILSGSSMFVGTSPSYSKGYAPARPLGGRARDSFDVATSYDRSDAQAVGAVAESLMSKEEHSNTAFSYEDKVLLSGPALPNWSWRSHQMLFSGPATPDTRIFLVLLSPVWTGVLSAVRSILVVWLFWVLFQRLGYAVRRFGPGLARAVVLMALCGGTSHQARAEFPTDALLGELEQHLSREYCQSNDCSQILEAHLSADRSSFQLSLKVSSKGISAVSLPGPLSVIEPTEVKINGSATAALRRTGDDYLQVRTPKGASTVEITGRLREGGAFVLQLPQLPLVMSIKSDAWFIEGLGANQIPAPSIRFIDKEADKSAAHSAPSVTRIELPSWMVQTKRVMISDQIVVRTDLVRLGSTTSAYPFSVRLLPGERVTTAAISVQDGVASGLFPAGTDSLSFSSTLPYTAELTLRAAEKERVSEVWEVRCAPIVHCQHSGLSPSSSNTHGENVLRWQPFPGEGVKVQVQPLSGIAGDLITIDSVDHRVEWGYGLIEGTVSMNLRATQQRNLGMTLPEGAAVKSVLLDGEPTRTQLDHGRLILLLNPGTHSTQVTYSLNTAISLAQRVPKILVDTPTHNVSVLVAPGTERWLIWTDRSTWGPAVVFWSKLVFVVLLCLGLTYFGLLPVSNLGAIFLGAGLATLPLVVIALPLTWLGLVRILPEWAGIQRLAPRWLINTGFCLLSLIALAIFYQIVQIGLVLQPPMLIAGNLSTSALLRWFVDHASEQLPDPWILSLPMWCWRVFALVWATWLAIAVIGWIRRSFLFLLGGETAPHSG